MIVTNSSEFTEKAKLIREYGWGEKHVSKIRGWNSRLDKIQAAILREKLKQLDRDNSKRIRIAKNYTRELNRTGIITPMTRNASTHVYHLYVIRSSKRDELLNYLLERNIKALIHYPVPLHLLPAYKDRLPGRECLQATELVSREVLSLPMYPELFESDTRKVIGAIKGFEGK